ncbi:hypothetical protein BC828DRAFT_292398 [Blastocladiella britannica]|nr:hypothetical protein BC828DRAFT_292398 [Blastocladiella britannica]
MSNHPPLSPPRSSHDSNIAATQLRPSKKRPASVALPGDPDTNALMRPDGTYKVPGFGQGKLYMQQKVAKMREQDNERVARSDKLGNLAPQIFAGMTIHINGYVPQVGLQELKSMVLVHGAKYDHYFSTKSTTHIVAANLTESKKTEFRAYKVATPSWILDSIAQSKLLPWTRYSALWSASRPNPFAAPTSPPVFPAPPATADLTLLPPDIGDLATTAAATTETATEAIALPPPLSPPLIKSIAPTTTTTDLAHRPRIMDVSADPSAFVSSYYANSRLHFLSIWKAELQAMTRIFQESRASSPVPVSPHRVLMHVDMDCYFASVAMLARPELHTVPFAVAHSTGSNLKDDSSSEIASCNYVARSFGVKNGMFLRTAKALCPALVVVPYQFTAYKATTAAIYGVLMPYADNLQAISCDEACIDVSSRLPPASSSAALAASALDLAHKIRADIFKATGGCPASVGIGENMLLARLATRKAKPDGAHFWTRDEYQEGIETIGVNNLPGVGRAMSGRFEELGIASIGQVKAMGLLKLQAEFGRKIGKSMYDASCGIDSREFGHSPRQTVSAEINYGIRFTTNEQAHLFLTNLSTEVAHRLEALDAQTQTITLKLMIRSTDAPQEPSKFMGHGRCDNHSRSVNLSAPASTATDITKHVVRMLDDMHFPPDTLRGIGISCTRLVLNSGGDSPATDSVTAQGSLVKLFERQQHQPSARVVTPVPPRKKTSLGIDWDVFAALPPDVQEEVLRENGLDAAQVPPLPPPGLDPGFLEALPPGPLSFFAIVLRRLGLIVMQWIEIRAEVLREHGQNKRSQLAPAPKAAPRSVTVLTPQPVPSLLNCTALPDVRALLRDWVEFATRNIAEGGADAVAEDVGFVRAYMEALVDSRHLDLCEAVVRYIHYLASRDGCPAKLSAVLMGVLETAQAKVAQVYGGRFLPFLGD